MISKSVNPQLQEESRFRSQLAPHQIALMILWLVTTIVMILMLIKGVGGTNLFIAIRQMLHVIYVVVLLLYLVRTGSSIIRLPEGNVKAQPRSKIVAWLPVLGVALLFLLNIVSDDGRDLLILLSLIASVTILLVWGRDHSLRLVIQGLAVATFAYLVGSHEPAVWASLEKCVCWESVICATGFD